MRELRQAYDLVLVDTSPLLAVTDPSVIAVVMDAILLVVRAAVTRRPDAERSQDLLKALETPVLGLVINGINAGQGGYGYGYGYLYSYGTYGRASSLGNGDEPAPGRLSDLASDPAEVPRIKLNGTNVTVTPVLIPESASWRSSTKAGVARYRVLHDESCPASIDWLRSWLQLQ